MRRARTTAILAVLVVATAKREGVPYEQLLKEMLHSVASFTIDMESRSQASCTGELLRDPRP